MQARVEIDRLRETPECPPEYAPASALGLSILGGQAQKAIPNLVYDLRLKDGNSDGYDSDVALFSAELLAEIELRAGTALDGYIHHVQARLREAPRSRGEYAVELLMLGHALARYGSAAESTPGWVLDLARELFWLRRRSARMKPVVDLARAAVIRVFLMPRIGRKPTAGALSPDRLPRLIEWLQATGEFEQEAMRLNNWRSFLATRPSAEAAHWIETGVDLFAWFERAAEEALGAYTRGVSRFLATEYARRGCREDQIFCGKEPSEYHLSMVAAEIMNQGLREEFERAARRAVLVPACMRGEHAASCRASGHGVDLTCTACDPACAVNRITGRMRRLGAAVYLVPHSTGFSRWLERWQGEPEVGVTAVACLLNILPGGYEMRARGIASQCVPLDYPGCQKHWSREGIPTSVKEERLAQIVQIAAPPRHA
jgi:hypothetical protein